jgi:hypothetical protein
MRLRLIGVSLLLCLALASTIFAAAGTVQAYQEFQQDHQRIMAGDVSTVSSWMTIPYVAHVYRVPETCLSVALHVSKQPQLEKHATLRGIAEYYRRPVNDVIRDVRTTILDYRQKGPACTAPPPESQLSSQAQPQSYVSVGGGALHE